MTDREKIGTPARMSTSGTDQVDVDIAPPRHLAQFGRLDANSQQGGCHPAGGESRACQGAHVVGKGARA